MGKSAPSVFSVDLRDPNSSQSTRSQCLHSQSCLFRVRKHALTDSNRLNSREKLRPQCACTTGMGMHTVRLPQFHCSALADSSNTQVGSISINCDSHAHVDAAGYSGGTGQALCVELCECCFDVVCAPSLKMVSTVYTSRTVSWRKGSVLHCRTRRWVPPCFVIEFVPRSNIVSNIVSSIPDPCPSLIAKLFPTVQVSIVYSLPFDLTKY